MPTLRLVTPFLPSLLPAQRNRSQSPTPLTSERRSDHNSAADPSHFKKTLSVKSAAALFLKKNSADTLPSITEGMFGYSLTRPVHNQEYYYSIFDTCQAFRCPLEGWHTETGPGVFEAVGVQLSTG